MPSSIKSNLLLECFPRRNDPNHGIGLPCSSNDDEHHVLPELNPRRRNLLLLFLGMFRIKEHPRLRIAENALGLFKPNSMLYPIDLVLPLVSIELLRSISEIISRYREG